MLLISFSEIHLKSQRHTKSYSILIVAQQQKYNAIDIAMNVHTLFFHGNSHSFILHTNNNNSEQESVIEQRPWTCEHIEHRAKHSH